MTRSITNDNLIKELGNDVLPWLLPKPLIKLMTSVIFYYFAELSAFFLNKRRIYMLFSLALIFLCGLLFASIFKLLKLPSLLGMIITGILLGPYALNILSPELLNISDDLRQLALIVILIRAGLALDIKDLLKVGRPAILMCFVPACFEIIGIMIIAPNLLGITLIDAAIMGSVLAAVSPAVIVPRMIKLIENGYGTDKSIPQLIMAGASVDDVFVIVLFSAFTGIAHGKQISAISFVQIPFSIILGIGFGIIIGILLSLFFKKFHMKDTVKVIIILSVSFLLVSIENLLKGIISFSGLLAIMAMSASLKSKKKDVAKRLSEDFSKLWIASEILLFVLVGATVNIQYALSAGIMTIFVVIGALAFRMLGVYLCMLKTKLIMKERFFCMLAYMPKATVQAAIGSIPLSMGLACGNIVLTLAVLSILITAPIGALAIDLTYKRLLTKDCSS